MKRTVLLLALLSIYGAFAFRGAVSAVLQRGVFDPLQPLGRAVEGRIGQKRFAEALPVALELQQAYPAEPLVAFWLAQIQHGLDHAAAEADAWERYIALSPAPAEACPALPRAYAQQRRMDQAVSAYERCARFAPEDADLLLDLGGAYASAGRSDDARAAFERAVRLDPDNPLPARQLAALRGAKP